MVWVSELEGRIAGETGFLMPTGVVGVEVISILQVAEAW
jgi:hypothetical protein